MRRFCLTLALVCLPGLGSAQAVDDITRGFSDGTRAGRRTGTLMPFATSAMIGPALAIANDGALSNNEIVATLVGQTALAAAASLAIGFALRPRPSQEQEVALSERPPLYAVSWRRGYSEASGQRQLLSRAVGVLTGAFLSGVIYGLRSEPGSRR